MKKRIVFYNDSPVYGGHESMAVQMANALVPDHDVFFLFNHDNIAVKLSEQVCKIKIPVRTVTGRLAFLRNLNFKDILLVRSEIQRIRPDLSIIAQPAIDFCIKGALASRLSGVRTVSYIPMFFPARILKGGLVGRAFDLLSGLYCAVFDSFITISNAQAVFLQNTLKGRKSVAVLENTSDVFGFPDAPGDGSLPGKNPSLTIGVVGRVSFHQKRQDRVVEIAEELLKRRKDFKFIIIGDGPDRSHLEAMVRQKKLENHFEFKKWVDNKSDIYLPLDVVLMVSEYEGVPLAVIEALYFGKMVLGQLTWGTGIYREYLDSMFLFSGTAGAVEKLSQAESLARAFSAKRAEVQRSIVARHGQEKFRKNLFEIVGRLLG